MEKYNLNPEQRRTVLEALERLQNRPPLPHAPGGVWVRRVNGECAEALATFYPDPGGEPHPLATWVRAGALVRLAAQVPTAPGIGSPIEWAAGQEPEVLNAIASAAHTLAVELEGELEDAIALNWVGGARFASKVASEATFEALCRARERLENLWVLLPRWGQARSILRSEREEVDELGGAFVIGREPPTFWRHDAWRQSARADWDVWWNGSWLLDPLELQCDDIAF